MQKRACAPRACQARQHGEPFECVSQQIDLTPPEQQTESQASRGRVLDVTHPAPLTLTGRAPGRVRRGAFC